ncbi:MAG TPA: metallophosphoesterase [Opitutaceae bacterium]|nr:metallophosphoesterase [Opitutaceae bacterium]
MLRILSDLHFRDAATRLRRLKDLEPLLAGVDELWLNGDTCDNQTGMCAEDVETIRRFFRSRVPVVHFLTGNHDPDISTDHWCATPDGRVCATHGDAFFAGAIPWSRQRGVLDARIRAAMSGHPELDDDTLDGRLALHRIACTGLPRECDPENPSRLHRLRRLVTEFWPPRQPLAMLHAWRSLPDRIAAVAPRWFPRAQVVVTGHVHFPKVWQRGALTVINTGAFTGPLGAYVVDVAGDRVAVHRLKLRRGRWQPGHLVGEMQLRPA